MPRNPFLFATKIIKRFKILIRHFYKNYLFRQYRKMIISGRIKQIKHMKSFFSIVVFLTFSKIKWYTFTVYQSMFSCMNKNFKYSRTTNAIKKSCMHNIFLKNNISPLYQYTLTKALQFKTIFEDFFLLFYEKRNPMLWKHRVLIKLALFFTSDKVFHTIGNKSANCEYKRNSCIHDTNSNNTSNHNGLWNSHDTSPEMNSLHHELDRKSDDYTLKNKLSRKITKIFHFDTLKHHQHTFLVPLGKYQYDIFVKYLYVIFYDKYYVFFKEKYEIPSYVQRHSHHWEYE